MIFVYPITDGPSNLKILQFSVFSFQFSFIDGLMADSQIKITRIRVLS